MDTQVHYNRGRGELTIQCGEQMFARVRGAVVEATNLKDSVADFAPETVQVMVIGTFGKPRVASGRFRDRLALLGCGVVAFAVLFVLVIGVGTIAGWVR